LKASSEKCGCFSTRPAGQISDLTLTQKGPWAQRGLRPRITGKLRFAALTIGACRGALPLCVSYYPPRLGGRGLK